MNVGYVRVSTEEQNETRQVEKMRSLEIEERYIFVEKASGKNFADRPIYEAMKQTVLREGDLLYIDSIDRLGRNYEEVVAEWRYLTRDMGIDVVALDMGEIFDSRKFKAQGDIGKLLENQMLTLLAWVAEQERNKIKIRQREGIEIAKKKGVYKGRKPIEVDEVEFARLYTDVLNGKRTNNSVMEELGLKRNTYYKAVANYKSGKAV